MTGCASLLASKPAAIGFLAAATALYAYGVLSAELIPAEVGAVALPFDFMVGIPAAFYLFVVRPRRLTPLAVLPVIWLGYGLSALALGSPNAGVLPLLLAALLPVELAIAVREAMRLVRTFRTAKAESADPMEWLFATTRCLVRKELPARMMAAELSAWYYALFSWRQKPQPAAGETFHAYHNAGGYLNMMLGLGLALPVEVVGVHLLLSQWSVVAACIATLLSAYAAVWLAGDARARVLRPVVVSAEAVRLRCGIQMEARMARADVERITPTEPECLGKADKLNYGTFYQANVWVVAKRPVEVRTLLGTKRVRAIGLSLDDPCAFASMVNSERIVCSPPHRVHRESGL